MGGHPIAIVSSTEKADRARKAGAASVIDLSKQNIGDVVDEITNSRGADLAFDPVGGPILKQLLRSVRRRGTVVSIGFTGGKEPAIDVFDLIVGEKRLMGYSLHHEPEDEISRALPKLNELAGEGLLRPTIDSTVPFEHFEKGYSRLGSRKAVGSITLRL